MSDKTDRAAEIVGAARQASETRARGYREQSLKIHPLVCARCGRSFERGQDLRELTVHHKDHNHDNNPPDGSNWENLCVYCHDNEHARYEEQRGDAREEEEAAATGNPFADLKAMMESKNK